MDTSDSYQLPNLAGGPRLLSESPIAGPHSSGRDDTDLSLSELSLAERPEPTRPFSLLACQPDVPATPPPSNVADDGELRDVDAGEPVDRGTQVEEPPVQQTREERLKSDLYMLRKLNATFAIYNEALSMTDSATDRLSDQLKQTNALLDKYAKLLGMSEKISRLIFDEKWEGAEADDAVMLEEAQRKLDEERRREEEERIADKRRQEQLELEEKQRAAHEQRERLQQEAADKAAAKSTSGVRGVRGTRASMRASASRATSTRGGSSTRGASTTRMATSGTSSIPSKIGRPASAAGSSRGATTTRGLSNRRPGS